MLALLWWELRAAHPMMPLRFFRIPAFSAGNTVAFSVSLGMFATFFFLWLPGHYTKEDAVTFVEALGRLLKGDR